jgi:hypothetical protein
VEVRKNGKARCRHRHLMKGGYQREFWLYQFLLSCFFFLMAVVVGGRKNISWRCVRARKGVVVQVCRTMEVVFAGVST